MNITNKIQTSEGYFILSEDSAIDELLLEKLTAEIKKQKKLTQPNFLIDMQYDYEMVQFQAIQMIIEQMQPTIQAKITSTPSLFASMACNQTEHNEIEVILPLGAFKWSKQHYATLRTALKALSTIQVSYPRWSTQKGYLLHGTGALCTYVAIKKDKNNRRREQVHFFFSQEIAMCLVSPEFGFTKLLKQTLQASKNVYTSKIYMYISRVANYGKLSISYENLRKKLCIGDKYPRYYDFRNRILKEAERELFQNSNYWFDMVECYKNKGAAAPHTLVFNIHSVDSSPNNLTQFKQLRRKIFDTMVDTLKIKKTTAQTIFQQINQRNANYIWRKHNMLLAYMAENEIQDIKAYYIQSIQQIISSEKYNSNATQSTLF